MHITEFQIKSFTALIVALMLLVPVMYVASYLPTGNLEERVAGVRPASVLAKPEPYVKPVLKVGEQRVRGFANDAGAGEFIYTILLTARGSDIYLQPYQALHFYTEDQQYGVLDDGVTGWHFTDVQGKTLSHEDVVHVPKDKTVQITLNAFFEAPCAPSTFRTYRLIVESVAYGLNRNELQSKKLVLTDFSSPFITVLSRTCEDSPEANTYDYSSEFTSEDQVIAIEGDPLEPQIGDPGDLNCYETPCGPLIESDPYDLDQKG